MRIKELYIDAYGIYTNYQLDLTSSLSPITIIYGPNEAGKSTLHAYLRSMLFGFQLKGMPNYDLVQGGRLGGRMTLEDETGQLYYLERSTPPKKGSITLLSDNGTKLPPTTLSKLLGHVSAPLFNSIFAFGHLELQRLEALQGEEIASYLYSAALGNGASQLVEIEKKMTKQCDTLFRPRASNPIINQLIREVEEQHQDVEKLQSKLANYTRLKERLTEMQQELDGRRQMIELCSAKRKLYEKVANLIELEQELVLVEIERNKLEKLPYALLPHREDLQVLFYEEQRMKEIEENMYRLDEQLKSGHQKLRDYFNLLGAEWTSERVMQLEQSIAVQDKWLQLVREKEETETLVWRKQEEYQQKEREIQAERKSSKTRIKRQKLLSVVGLGAACLLPLLIYLWTEQSIASSILLVSLLWLTNEQYQKWKENERKERHYTQLLSQFRTEIESQAEELATIQAQVKEELQAQHIPPHLSSGGLTQLLNILRATQQELTNVAQLEEQRRRYELEINGWQATVNHIATNIPNLSGTNPFVVLAELRERLTIEEQKEAELSSIQTKQDQLLQQQKALLQTIEFEKLNQAEKLALQELDQSSIAKQLTDLELEYSSILQEIERVAKECGKLETELDALASEGESSKKQQELEESKAHLQQEANKWATYTLAEYLCQQIRHIYEVERQPTVLKNASRFFEKMTLGRYKQIIIPFAEKKMMVIRQDNLRLGVDELSQGTVEQLYLAMRFAVVQDYEKVVSLPLIIDDIFVNFDRQRAKEALYGLAELAHHHQIIYFTCHEHMLEIMKEVLGEVNIVELIEAKTWEEIKG